MPRPARQPPRELAPGWPAIASDDVAAETARRLAGNLRAAMGDRSARAVEALTSVDHTVIGKVLNGRTWADLATIARLENGLGAPLWPTMAQDRPRDIID